MNSTITQQLAQKAMSAELLTFQLAAHPAQGHAQGQGGNAMNSRARLHGASPSAEIINRSK